MEPVVLHKHGLLNLVTQEFFSISFFDKITIHKIPCPEVEEVTSEEDDKQESSLAETNITMATLETIPMHLKWGQIFSLSDKTR